MITLRPQPRQTIRTRGQDARPSYLGTAGGPPGPPGEGLRIRGTVANEAALPGPVGLEDGDGYITDDDGHLWIWDGDDFTDVGLLRGPAGPSAPDGSTSVKGIWQAATPTETAGLTLGTKIVTPLGLASALVADEILNPEFTDMIWTGDDLVSWSENGIEYTATYEDGPIGDRRIATLTVGDVTRAFSYDDQGRMTEAI